MKEAIIAGHYDPVLVAVSIIISICASYVALDLAGRITEARGKIRFFWLSGGSLGMGTGIWAMHYIGMLAFRLPVPVRYHVPTVGVSLLAAVFASAVALYVVSRDRMRPIDLVWGSLVMGSGICAMHYIGMVAMRLPAYFEYRWKTVGVSALIAVAVAGAALFIAFHLREHSGKKSWTHSGSALVMGLAVCAMHYTGMAAICFHSCALPGNPKYSVGISSLGVAGIIAVTLLVLLIALLGAMVDRHFALQRGMLGASQREYRLLVEHNLTAVCRTSLTGSILDANPTCIRILGYENLQQLVGVNIADHYWHPEDRIRIVEQLRARGFLNSVEVCLKRRNGTPLWVIYNLALAQGPEGHLTEVVASAMDISATKQTQQELLTAKEQAEAATLAKSQFLTNMSHELRTPLNGVLGMTALVLDSRISSETRECLEVVKTSADTLLEIVNNVLDFSKFEMQNLVLHRSEFDLPVLLHDALRAVSPAAFEKNIRIITEFSPDLPKRVLGDAGRLRQILLNLLGNAVKFTHEGEVTLSAKAERQADNATLHVSVRDTGIGIPADKLNTVFDAFSQADNSSTRSYGGVGLGLAIATRLVGAMGGSLRVESRAGQGSAFRFDLQIGIAGPKSMMDQTPNFLSNRS